MTMKMLSRDQLANARTFLFESARPLEKHLFMHLFGGLPADQAVVELARYCNPDGGFGKALEPDMRDRASSTLATSVALQWMRLCKLDADHELVQHALGYLMETLEDAVGGKTGRSASLTSGGWRIIPDAARTSDTDKAPWWSAPPDATNTCAMFNPSAELLGYLIEWGREPNAKPPSRQDAKETNKQHTTDSDSSWRLGDLAAWRNSEMANKANTVAAFVVDQLNASADPLESHDLLCLMRLAQTPNLPEELADVVIPRLQHDGPLVATTDPKQWGGYGLMPLWLAPTPDALAVESLGHEILNANLDYEIDRQDAMGYWDPFWDWGPDNRAAWEMARTDWQGVLTLNTLLALRAYDRIDPGTK